MTKGAILEATWQKIKKLLDSEGFRYLFFGGLSTVFSIASFALLKLAFPYTVANLISLVLTKLFAYITNKLFVFQTRTESFGALMREFFSFIGARMVTFVIDYFGLILMVETLHMNSLVSKVILQVIVIALNYVFSKLFVFKKKDVRKPS